MHINLLVNESAFSVLRCVSTFVCQCIWCAEVYIKCAFSLHKVCIKSEPSKLQSNPNAKVDDLISGMIVAINMYLQAYPSHMYRADALNKPEADFALQGESAHKVCMPDFCRRADFSKVCRVL